MKSEGLGWENPGKGLCEVGLRLERSFSLHVVLFSSKPKVWICSESDRGWSRDEISLLLERFCLLASVCGLMGHAGYRCYWLDWLGACKLSILSSQGRTNSS